MVDKALGAGTITDGGAATTGDKVLAFRTPNSREVTLGDLAGRTMSALTAKVTPVGADIMMLADSAASNVPKRTTITEFLAAIIATAYQPLATILTAIAALGTNGLIARTGSGTIAARTFTAGAGLTGTNLDGVSGNPDLAVGAGTGITVNADDVAVDKATNGNMWAGTSNKVVTADRIVSAAAGVALTDAATIALNWNDGQHFTCTVTASRILGNPTNGQPGTWRTLLIIGNDATDRALTFGNQWLNDLPTITDIDSGRPYLCSMFCESSTVFHFFAAKGRDV